MAKKVLICAQGRPRKGTVVVSLERSPPAGVVSASSLAPFHENYKLPAFQQLLLRSGMERFVVGGRNWWYLFQYALYNAGFAVAHSLSLYEAVYLVDLLEAVRKRYPSARVEVADEKHAWLRGLHALLTGEAAFARRSRAKTVMLRAAIAGRIKARGLLARPPKGGSRLLAVASDRFKRERREENQFWGPLIEQMERRGEGLRLLEYDQLRDKRAVLSWRRFRSPRVDAYVGDYHSRSYRRAYRHYLRVLAQVREQTKPMLERMTYKGYRLAPLVDNRLRMVFETLTPYYADLLATAEEVLHIERPRAVLVDQEENHYAKAFMYVAKDLPTKVIALQYELVYPNCLHAHTKSAKVRKRSSPLWRPVPDVKLVSGSYAKKVLIEHCDYPASALRVVGQPRYDPYFHAAKASTERTRVRKSLGVHGADHCVLYLASSWRNDKGTFMPLLSALEQHKQIHLIVKAHPAEADGGGAFLDALSDSQLQRYTVVQQHDLVELFTAADLLISVGSTTISEGLIFRRPCLMLTYYRGVPPIPYERYGAVIPVHREQELPRALTRGLAKGMPDARLRRGMEAFLRAYLYKEDGKAAQRAASEILKYTKH